MSDKPSRLRRFALAAGLLAAALAATPGWAQSLSDLTPEQAERIPPERLRQMPYLDAMELLVQGFSRMDGILKIQVLLHDLWFYSGPPSGQESNQLADAIKAFQRSIDAAPTGVLLAGQFEELDRRVNYMKYTPVYLPEPRRIATTEEVALVSGTWARREGSGRYPIQTSRLECDRNAQTCTETTAVLSEWDGSDGANLTLVTTFWNVTKWTEREIVADKDSPGCIAATLTIYIVDKAAHQLQQPRGDEACEGIEAEPQMLDLVDGQQVANGYWNARQRLAQDYLGPELRERLGRLDPAAPSR